MAQITYIASTVVMGLLVAGVLAALLNRTTWRGYAAAGADPRASEQVEDLLASPTTWTVGFLALVGLFGVGAVVAVGGVGISAGAAQAAAIAIAGFFAGLLGLLAFVGMYNASRSRGRPSSFAAAEGAGLIGLLVLAAIVIKLAVAA